jgi:hypothetical protein
VVGGRESFLTKRLTAGQQAACAAHLMVEMPWVESGSWSRLKRHQFLRVTGFIPGDLDPGPR